ncbi:MAG: hypothetical protein JNJ57_02220, partial [Saprospiraceae bacterium]|nr:hypothetical protein [Saprospiraceae bacterium]
IDKKAGVSTIPIFLGANKSAQLSQLALALFFIVSVVHYTWSRQYEIIAAFSISFASTWIFLSSATIKRHRLYYEGILDGTLFLQGLLVLACYFL